MRGNGAAFCADRRHNRQGIIGVGARGILLNDKRGVPAGLLGTPPWTPVYPVDFAAMHSPKITRCHAASPPLARGLHTQRPSLPPALTACRHRNGPSPLPVSPFP